MAPSAPWQEPGAAQARDSALNSCQGARMGVQQSPYRTPKVT